MIHNKDRSGWFGASDTSKIMSKWQGKTFDKWWLVKLGLSQESYTNLAMQTGTALEHRILDYLGIVRRDRQIKIRKYCLRVNLDGETPHEINEIKTHSADVFTVSKAYWQQAQVEMFAAKKKCKIVAYQITSDDYRNWYLPIDPNRLTEHPIKYNEEWVNTQYLTRLKYLATCLRSQKWPKMEDFKKWQKSTTS